MVDAQLVEVRSDNWRACVALRVAPHQQEWVADVAFYLCLCTYGEVWKPLAVQVEGRVVGFVMWGVDDDRSRWIGGLVVDRAHQRQGVARTVLPQLIQRLVNQEGCTQLALSCSADNKGARHLYASLGFVETGDTTDDGELVSRLSLAGARRLLHGSQP